MKSGPCKASCIRDSLVKLLRLSRYDVAVCVLRWQRSGNVLREQLKQLNSLPVVYVGSLTRFKQLLQLKVEAARSSLKKN
ncbi:hypothetical protein Gotur_007344 [Gossypium turneri]